MAYTTIDDPSEYFITTLYTGNATDDRSITNSANAGNFKPDWVWGKNRTSAGRHTLADSSRGPTKNIFSERNDAEATEANVLQAFETNGFQIGSDTRLNDNNASFVAWQWKANGGTTSSNTDGSITSTVQANTTAGFSIVTYTGNGSDNATVGHGLGKIPAFVLVKNRDDSDHWGAWHQSFAAHTSYNSLSQTMSTIDNDDIFKAFSSTLFTLGTDSFSNTNNEKYVAYCFSEIQGYSKFGSYIGNYNADGPSIYTGFKPAFVIVKKSSGTGDWRITDNKRDPFNIVDGRIKANTSAAEDDNDQFDYLSNGFKVRAAAGDINSDEATHIYLAFAESPFVSSKGVPTTAR